MGNYYIKNPPGNLCSISVERSRHGTPEQTKLHLEEMKNAAVYVFNQNQDIIRQMIRDEAADIVKQCIDEVIEAIHYDINSCFTIAFDDIGRIFTERRCQQMISKAISDKIAQRLKDIKVH